MTCPSTQVHHCAAFVAEVYTWTALGLLIFAARFAVRLRIRSWRRLQGDDYMAIVTLLMFMSCIAGKMTVYYIGPNSDQSDESLRTFTKCQMAKVVMASKVQVFLWYAYVSFLWGLKATVLFFVSRLPLRLYQRRLLKLFVVMSGLAFVAIMITLTCTCLPFRLGWATIPRPPPKCTSRMQNYYPIMATNIATDLAILTVVFPLLWQLRVSVRRRVALTLLLCSGIFVTSAALVSLCMSLTDPTSTINTNLWGTREEIAGIAAVNAPVIRPIFLRAFWTKGFDPSRRARTHPIRQKPLEAEGFALGDRSRRQKVASKINQKFGVITSIGSSSSKSSTGYWTSKSADTTYGPYAVGSQRVYEDEFEDLEWAWGVSRDTSTTRGPCPLLPEPSPNFASVEELPGLGGLQPIVEEDEPIAVIEGIASPPECAKANRVSAHAP